MLTNPIERPRSRSTNSSVRRTIRALKRETKTADALALVGSAPTVMTTPLIVLQLAEACLMTRFMAVATVIGPEGERGTRIFAENTRWLALSVRDLGGRSVTAVHLVAWGITRRSLKAAARELRRLKINVKCLDLDE